MTANARDLALASAEGSGVGSALMQRLELTDAKLETLASGVEQLAHMAEPLGQVRKRTELADGMELTQVSVPIGVVLIVFESRPDSLPQIASLALRSANGLLLKGGKEASHSNACLHGVVVDAVFDATQGRVGREVIGLVTSRDEVSDLLRLDGEIDLVSERVSTLVFGSTPSVVADS